MKICASHDAALPAARFIVNLCEDRYHYAVLLAACALSGRVSLQPSSQSEATLRQLAQDYAGAIAVTDAPTPLPPELPAHPLPDLGTLPSAPCSAIPRVAPDATVAILFTSGSTGLPQPHASLHGARPLRAAHRPVATQPERQDRPQGACCRANVGLAPDAHAVTCKASP